MCRVFLFILFPCLFLASCSSSSDNVSPSEDVENRQDQSVLHSEDIDVGEKTSSLEATPEINREEVSAIEIEWRAPNTKVMRYKLRYGRSPDNLDSEEDIKLEDLKVEVHPVHGTLYKYILIGLPAKAVIYYTLQAENEFGLSEPTPVAKEEVR